LNKIAAICTGYIVLVKLSGVREGRGVVEGREGSGRRGSGRWGVILMH